MLDTTEQNIYKLENLDTLIKKLIVKGYRVIGPKREDNLVLFREIQSESEIDLSQVNTNSSIKDLLFPRSEKILSFEFVEKKVEIEDPRESFKKTVIIGAKPCDTASLPVMDKLFQDDCSDPFWTRKRNSTTIISFACTKCDEYCFCTSVGLSPDSKKGADIMLTEGKSGEKIVEIITDKGSNLAKELTEIFNDNTNVQDDSYVTTIDQDRISKVETVFDVGKVKQWLDNNFEDVLWEEFSRQCIGCGACTFLCPTCHCFDIVDEGTLNKGDRLKNWDACQMKTFTVHTSGHNPRSSQAQRWRQRIMHKFKYYVDKFDEILCVGCGRCSRHCPVDMNISECLSLIAEKNND
ncbi:MAG: 4Fe-4S dicluster domain-containing protein [Candidatus Anammoxibacter sp.]